MIAERYRLERRISVGASGEIWAARHDALDLPVAVKLLHASLVGDAKSHARFRREAKATARMRSEHVVEVLDLGETDGRPFIVMEYLEGRDLGSWLSERGAVTREVARRIAIGVGRGLRRAHGLGLVHRDLKPANIFMVGAEGETVKVVDFGIAKDSRHRPIEADEPTARGEILGSPRYMSPEQVRGWALDAKSDLWAFAAVLYRALVGMHAFDGRSVTDVMLAIWHDEPPAPSTVRPELGPAMDAFFVRAFQKNPDARWPDADTFVYAFVAALAEGEGRRRDSMVCSSEGDRVRVA